MKVIKNNQGDKILFHLTNSGLSFEVFPITLIKSILIPGS